MRRFLIVSTRRSGGWRLRDINAQIIHFFDQHNIEYTMKEFSGDPKDLDFKSLYAEFAFTSVLIVGGDGTFRRVLEAMHFQQRTEEIAFYPKGSTNVIAKIHKIPKNLSYLLSPNIKKINTYLLNKKYLFCIALVVGRFANISILAHDLGKHFLGFFSYILGFIHVFFISFFEFFSRDGELNKYSSVIILTSDFSRYLNPKNKKNNALIWMGFATASFIRSILDFFSWVQFSKINKTLEITEKDSYDFMGKNIGKMMHLDGDIIEINTIEYSVEKNINTFSLLLPSR